MDTYHIKPLEWEEEAWTDHSTGEVVEALLCTAFDGWPYFIDCKNGTWAFDDVPMGEGTVEECKEQAEAHWRSEISTALVKVSQWKCD